MDTERFDKQILLPRLQSRAEHDVLLQSDRAQRSWRVAVRRDAASDDAHQNPSPSTLKETGWYGNHRDNLSRIYSSPTLQVFHDEWETNATSAAAIQWLTPALEEAWAYTRSLYQMHSGPQLFAILNAAGKQPTHEAYDVGGALYGYTADNGYRNSVFTMSDRSKRSRLQRLKIRSLIHELNHIVESNNHETMNSPSYAVWGDSHWGEIFMYDVYKHLAFVPSTGVTLAHAEELRTTWWNARDEFGGQWLQDWYYPLYMGTLGNAAADKSGSAFLVKYFELLSRYFPTTANVYARNLNLGEYVHFCSAAAGVDLTAAARKAFRFERHPEVEAQLGRAQLDFPEVSAMYLANRKPGFTFENVTRTGTAGTALSGATLAGTATDPNLGATLTYTKVSGPSWLTISANGALTGTPSSAGNFTVQIRVTDNGGLADTATLVLRSRQHQR
ncbi:MAG: Ig domain-containing protein [Polyangiaceae bacterium]